MKNFDRSIARRRAKSLRNGVHHANAIVWGPVCRTRDDARSHLVALALERRELLSEQLRLGGRRHRDFEGDATAIARDGCDASARADAASKEALLNARPAWRWRISRERDERSSKRTPPRLLASARRATVTARRAAAGRRSHEDPAKVETHPRPRDVAIEVAIVPLASRGVRDGRGSEWNRSRGDMEESAWKIFDADSLVACQSSRGETSYARGV